MKTREDISGTTINNKKVIRSIGQDKWGKTIYEIECQNCKNISNLGKSNLIRTKDCKFCTPRNNLGPLNPRWRGGKIIPKDYFSALKRNSISRNLDFNISIDFIESLYEKQKGLCFYTGENIDFFTKTASLDRINSNIGYIETNVQWVHKDINAIKTDIHHDKFIQYMLLISSYSSTIKIRNKIPIYELRKHKNFKGCGYIGLTYFYRINYGAQKRNIAFPITIEDLNNRFIYQSGKCELTGLDLTFSIRNKNKKYTQGTASLDRINSNKDYTIDNIQWVHKDINFIKYNLDEQRLLEIAQKVSKNYEDISNM